MTRLRPPLPDDDQRIRVRTSPRSLAVEASAGTGKTWLLVVRALWLILVRKVPADAIVALAFGEKAATELRQRLRDKLGEIVRAPTHDALDPDIIAMAPTEPLAGLQARAAGALEALERAHVSTIHAFASTLLRLYPAEAGVDPGFEVVEDAALDQMIAVEWSRFIAAELGEAAPHREAWLAVLARVRLADLADLAEALAGYETDLEALPTAPVLSGPTREWLLATAHEAETLHASIRPGLAKARTGLESFAAVLREAATDGQRVLTARATAIEAAADLGKGDVPREFSTDQYRALKRVTTAAKVLRAVPEEGVIFTAVILLLPFARRAREVLCRAGRIPYAGLLALARDLVRDHPQVRLALKRRFRAILLDEAQDVDPMQLELILYLAEAPGAQALGWSAVQLEPGKLFVVGDPKQAIYGFRGADVRAFQAAVELMTRQGAETLVPVTSMRSAQPVLDAVNRVGNTLFASYPVLAQRPSREAPTRGGTSVEVLLVAPEDGEDGEAVEAAAVAARVQSLLDGGLQPGDIAVLFRKRSPMPAFADAFKAAGIHVAIEQERRFFLRTEIMDLINVLRLVADPTDEVARVGFLRGPYYGCTDEKVAEVLALSRTGPDPVALAPVLRPRLASEAPREWLEALYQELGIEAVAAASADPGARDAVRAFRQMVGNALEEYGLPRTLELLEESLRAEADFQGGRQPPLRPAQRPSADASGTVRFLTVHNAKGLEFPAVVLACIDATPQAAHSTDTTVLRDWAGGTHGITLRAIGAMEAASTLDACRLKALRSEEEREETGRLVYVALTRARDTLMIVDRKKKTGRQPGPTADTLRPFLAPLLADAEAPIRRTVSTVTRSRRTGTGPQDINLDGPGVPMLRSALVAEADLVSPTELDERMRRDDDDGIHLPAGTRNARAWLGELCHEVLRDWDFTVTDSGPLLPAALDRAAARLSGARVVPEGLRRQALDILVGFLKSETGQMLSRAEILGREVPLLALVDGRTISARADIVYKSDGPLVIGDYKLSRETEVSPDVHAGYILSGSAAFQEPCVFAILPLDPP